MFFIVMSFISYGVNDDYEYQEIFLDSLLANSTDNAYGPQQTGTSAKTDNPRFLIPFSPTNLPIVGIKILEVMIPFTYYVFNSYNNTFTLTETGTAGSAVVTIPVGNYSQSTLTPVLVTLLNAASATIGNSNTYTVTYSSTTQLLTFAIPGNSAHAFTLIMGDYTISPRLWLGLSLGTNVSSNVGGTQTLVSPNVARITGPNYFTLNSRALSGLPVEFPQGNTQLINNDVVCCLPTTSMPSGVTFWQDPCPEKVFRFSASSVGGSYPPLDFWIGMGPDKNVMRLNGDTFTLKLGLICRKIVSSVDDGNLKRTFGNMQLGSLFSSFGKN